MLSSTVPAQYRHSTGTVPDSVPNAAPERLVTQ